MAKTYGGESHRHDPGHVHVPGERVSTGTEAYGPITTEAVPLHDRVRWGPIIAGLLTSIVTLLILTVLGLAIGMSVLEPGQSGDRNVGTAAAIWGTLSALVAFFLGGWVAARSAAVEGGPAGALNGLMVGIAAIVLVLWLIGAGLGNLLGFVGTNLAEITDLARTVDPTAAEDALPTAQAAYENTRNSAWGTFAGLVLALGAASLGGYLGHNHGAIVTRPRAATPVRGPRARA
jgi:hypothetical protein